MSGQERCSLTGWTNRISPLSNPGIRQWLLTGVASLTIVAAYVLVYVVIRKCHRYPDGHISIDTGSNITNRVFAIAIHLEKCAIPIQLPGKEALFEEALKEAQSTDRTILIILGTENCLPCRQLERFLQQQHAILSKYVLVFKANVGRNLTQGAVVNERYRCLSDTDGYTNYFPWIAFVDINGGLIVCGDDNADGLIGIPHGGPQDRAWFLQMLRIANPKMTESDVTHIGAAAEAYHKRIWNNPSSQ